MDRKEFFGAVPFAAMMGLPAERPGRVLSAVEERFIGVYTLISSGGSGENPIGRIYYDRAGRMGAMLHPRERRPLPESPTVEDYREMLRGLTVYFGTYTIDESTTRVIHHLESALNPAEIGAERVRWYEFVGDNRLHLYTREGFTGTPLVWERLPAG
jgi:hypothetical protein